MSNVDAAQTQEAKPRLQWTRPKRDTQGNTVRASVCGRYTLTTQTSSLGGRRYCLRADGGKIGTYGSLSSAMGWAEVCECNRVAFGD